MRTAKEWARQFPTDIASDAQIEPLIRKIQADSLRRAAEIARQLNESVNANEGWHIMNSLTEEADKLETNLHPR